MENYPPPAAGSAGGAGQAGNEEETILQAILFQSTTLQNPDLQWLRDQLQAHYNDDYLDHELWLCQMYGNSPTVANLCGTRPITAAEAEDAWDELVGAYYTWYNTVYQPATAGDIPSGGQSGATTSVQDQPAPGTWTDDDTAWLTDFLNACTRGKYQRNKAGLKKFLLEEDAADEVADAFIRRAQQHYGGADTLAQVLADTRPATGPVSAPQQQTQGTGYLWTPDPAPQPAPAAPLHPHPHPATPAWSQKDENVLNRWLDWLAQMDQQPTWNTIANGLAQLLASQKINAEPAAWWTTAWQSPSRQIAYLRQNQSRKADLSVTLDAQITYAWESTRRALANQQQQTQNQPQAQPPAYTWTPDPQTQPQTTPQTHPPAQHPAAQSSSGQSRPGKRKPAPDPNVTEHKSNQPKRQRPVGENAFSQKMWELREKAKLSQKETGERLKIAQNYIAQYESGSYIDPDTAHRWIQAVTDDPNIQGELQALYDAIYRGRKNAGQVFGERMQQLRIRRGFPQRRVGKEIGVSQAMISQWESGANITVQESANRWINFLTAGLQDRENVRRELRQLYEKATGRKFSWTD